MDARRTSIRRGARSALISAGAACLVAVVAGSVPGCATGGTGTGARAAGSSGSAAALPPAQELELAIADQRSGRHEAAADRAAALLGRTDGLLRDQAAYVAGVALLDAGRLSESERMLAVARRSGDQHLRARAEAASGLVHSARGRDREAIAAFDRAWDDLGPRDRGRAATAAMAIATRTGDHALERRWADRRAGAVATISGGELGFADDRWRDGWAIQVGAFSLRSLAETAAERAGRRIDRGSFGDPRIIPRWSPSGESELLYVVQFGAFGSEAEASAAIRRHGWAEWIVRESAG